MADRDRENSDQDKVSQDISSNQQGNNPVSGSNSTADENQPGTRNEMMNQNQTESGLPGKPHMHAVGTHGTDTEGNLGGRNPGDSQETPLGDMDANTSRGETVADPMTSRDPSINPNLGKEKK